jgi:hypothetical protein
VHDGQFAGLPQVRKGAQGGVQSKETIQVNGAVVAAVALGDLQGGALAIVFLLALGDYGVEPVHAAALEDHHQNVALRRLPRWGKEGHAWQQPAHVERRAQAGGGASGGCGQELTAG